MVSILDREVATLNVVDLFCGLKGWSSAFAVRGHNVWTTDIDDRFEASLTADIRKIEKADIPFRKVDVLLASPPCETFSVASIGTHWTGGKRAYVPRTAAARLGMELVEKTVALSKEINADVTIIENPRGVLRNLGIIPVDPITVWYCHYGETRAKPTDLWGMPFPEGWKPEPECHNNRGHEPECCCHDHERAPRGAKTGTQGLKTYSSRSKVPYDLSLSVCEAIG